MLVSQPLPLTISCRDAHYGKLRIIFIGVYPRRTLNHPHKTSICASATLEDICFGNMSVGIKLNIETHRLKNI